MVDRLGRMNYDGGNRVAPALSMGAASRLLVKGDDEEMMVRFLGTAAYEGIPSMFCRCELCRKAMELGGKNMRTRTSVMLGDDMKIDFPPDTLLHTHRDRLDLELVKDLLFTHSHSDHLYPEDLGVRLPGYAQSADHPIHIYAHDLPLAKSLQVLRMEGGTQGKFELHRIQPFERTATQTAVIVPLPASHDRMETCLLYYIEKDGKNILYGHDSGDFPMATMAWLKDKKLDLAILECTVGHSKHSTNHMNIEATVEAVQQLREYGALTADSHVVVTHFSHNAGLTHEDLSAIFEPHGIIVAYDRMVLDI